MPKNTLLNYFGRSPSSTCKKKTASKSTSDIENSPPQGKHLNKLNYAQGDLIWAKRRDNQWWPGLIWRHLETKTISRCHQNSIENYNTYFFNCTMKSHWISSENICSFQGKSQVESGGQFHTVDSSLLEAVELACRALQEPQAKRLQLLEKNLQRSKRKTETMETDECNSFKQPVNTPSSVRQSRECASVKKYRRIIESDDGTSEEDDDDDDKEYKPDKKLATSSISKAISSDESEDYTSPDEEDYPSPEEEPVEIGKKRKRSSLTLKPSKAVSTTQVKSKLVSFQAPAQPVASPDTQGSYLHETLDFLKPCNIRDANGRRPDDPQYDKTTLKVSSTFLSKLTPAMYQWWNIKAMNFDVVLFFKVGKFYELYHMDAVVGVKELGLTYMKGNFAHSGFPEVAFGRYSAALVQKGYTVARVEQTETPEQNSQRIKGKVIPKYEKTLRREICRITTKGTQMHNVWDESSTHSHGSNFLLAVCERMVDRNDRQQELTACREIGVCFVDTSIGVFHLGQFYDDGYCSRFRTMISHYFPSQVLYERGKLSNELSKILHTGLASVLQCGLTSGSQFWDSTRTLKTLSDGGYFVKNDTAVEDWPSVLRAMKSDTDSLGLTAKSECELALSSLGGCICYLKKCLIDFEVISMRQFQHYVCEEQATSQASVSTEEYPNIDQRLILDSATLNNLEIVHNSKGSREGSLIAKLDHCKTPFGRRLLRQWVCSPPCHPHTINARLDALDDLMENSDVVEALTATLSKMPDLERMLTQIHSMSKGAQRADHPACRAILYEEKIYSKKKINDFMSILWHYESLHKCLRSIQDRLTSFKSSLLQKILGLKSNDSNSKGAFPDMEATLMQWKKAFDHKKAKETGKIVPNVGTNPEYDEAVKDIASVTKRAEEYLREQKKKFCCSKIMYKGSGNKRFQIEIPLDSLSKRVPDEYEISGQRKGFKSFRTSVTASLVKSIEEAEARRDSAQADSMSIIFREFSKDFIMWKAAVEFLSQVDVLISLTQFSKGTEGIMCRPEVLLPSQCSRPMLDIREGRHPCVTKTLYSDSFIPNDTQLGCCAEDIVDSAKLPCLLLTGPNMGGKSTLMRQVGLLVVLAQMGCYVPAQSCKLTVCDRIFTRLGAFDRIMAVDRLTERPTDCGETAEEFVMVVHVNLEKGIAHKNIVNGESTFFVELGETSSILKHVSVNSLVLLDELGRGTSTYDGTAIASAVLKHIAQNVGCRTIFSTHYRALVDDSSLYNNVQLGHMACMVEDGDSVVEEVLTFLYKLASGACPKSYGFHAALLAGVSDDIIRLAQTKALELEIKKKDMALFRKIFEEDYDITALMKLS